MDGFFGQYDWPEANQLRSSRGIRTVGLPYEDEPSITKHMAHFLSKNPGKKPHWLLFNGGAFKPQIFQEAITSSLRNWFPDTPLQILPTVSLDLAVSRGASYYGKVRRGMGVRISGGSARSYYLEVAVDNQQKKQALCLLPRGAEEGTKHESSKTFSLSPNKPVSFTLLSSHVRLGDKVEDVIPISAEEMQPLPPIYTFLKAGKSQDNIPVHLLARFTEVGTFELHLKSLTTPHEWNLAFQIRTESGQDDLKQEARHEETLDVNYLKPAHALIADVFANRKGSPDKLIDKLEIYLEKPKIEWESSILRGLWDELFKYKEFRRISQEHEIRWWNLIGFLLRPGFGYPLDEYRIKELWKLILSDLPLKKSNEVMIQTWITYRRIAGGLNKGQQTRLANEILPYFFAGKGDRIELKNKSEIYPFGEKARALASFELVDFSLKIRLGNAFLHRIEQGEGMPADFWALGRIGARHLISGTFANVLPAETVNKWIERLLKAKIPFIKELGFLYALLGQETDHFEQSISKDLRVNLIEFLSSQVNGNHYVNMMSTQDYSKKDQEFILGDSLPAGLTLKEDWLDKRLAEGPDKADAK